MKLPISVMCLLISAGGIFSQPLAPDSLWTYLYGGDQDDYSYCVQETGDGGYVIAGRTFSFGAGNYDLLLLKLDSEANSEWSQTYGGTLADMGRHVVQADDGGYAVCGYTTSFGAGSYDGWFLKLDSGGAEEYSVTYGETNYDYLYMIESTADGGYIMAGHTMSFEADGMDGWIIKTNWRGIEEWSRVFGYRGNDYFYSVAGTTDGGYIIAGRSDDIGDYNAWLVKLDSTGNYEWDGSFGQNGADYGYTAIETADGGYAMAGKFNVVGSGNTRGWIIKTDDSGEQEWDFTYGGGAADYLWGLVQTPDNGFIATGASSLVGAGLNDFLILKIGAAGMMEWSKTFGGFWDDYGVQLCITSDGGIAAAGYSESFSSPVNQDVYVVKLDETATEIMEIPAKVPADFTALKCYPNPFNSRAVISFELPAAGQVKIDIFDITGRSVGVQYIEPLQAGNHEIVWDAEGMASGVYLVRLTADGGRLTAAEKVLLVK